MNNSTLHIGLSKTDIEGIVTVIRKSDKVKEAILFGSRAKGTFTNGSDIDLALKGTNLGLNDILDLSIELDSLNLPYKFDLIIYDRIKEEALKEHINRVGIALL